MGYKKFCMKRRRKMKNVIDELKKEIAFLDKIITKAEEDLKCAPEGILRISKSGSTMQYYRRKNEKDKNGKYIRRSDRDIAYKLAQKDYDADVIEAAKEQRKKIERFLEQYNPNQIKEIYMRLAPERKMMISPYIMTDEQYTNYWKNRDYIGKGFMADMPEIYTERGERVRSKSEKIIADKLDLMNVPYLYEYPLKLKGYGVVYPDFTLLNIRTREEYYLEHFGMMDDPNYSESTIHKIESYAKNGIYPGEKLLMTFENSKSSINMKVFEQMIKKYLL